MAESVVLLTRKKVAKPRRRELPVVGKGKSHIHRTIERIEDGPYYTVKEVAFLIERDLSTVKRWIRSGRIERASKYIKLHGELVYLYTPDDVERFREFAESL